MSRTVVLLASVAAALLLASGVALAYPADLDTSFGGDGIVVTDFAPPEDPRSDYAHEVVVQPDGKIVAVGFTRDVSGFDFVDYDLAVARYHANGSLDKSFDGDGRVTLNLGTDTRDILGFFSLSPQSDGKILVAGNNSIARYNTDGSLDISFGGDGKVTNTFSHGIRDLAAQGSGDVLAAGYHGGDFAVARYNSDGSLDTSFDGGGMVTTDLGSGSEGGAIALQSNGKILMGGEATSSSFGIVRYNSDGSLDTSFDGDGKVITNVTSRGDFIYDMLIQPDGRVLVGGEGASGLAGILARYNADGSLDTSFNSDGIIASESTPTPLSIALQADGKIVAQNYGAGVWRYEADGTLDSSLSVDSQADVAADLTIQDNGRIVLAGAVSKNGSSDFALVRHMGGSDDTPPQTSLTTKPAKFTNKTSASFTFASSEERSTFRCNLDDEPFKPCGSGQRFSSLTNGTHTLRVQATDAAGNTDPTPSTYRWTVDTKRPTGSVLINGDRASTNSRSVTLRLSAADPSPASGVASMRFKNKGGDWSAWKSYATGKDWFLSSGAGTKTVYVQYKDRAGNISETASDTITLRP